jgi:hypothetical protein
MCVSEHIALSSTHMFTSVAASRFNRTYALEDFNCAFPCDSDPYNSLCAGTAF